MVECVTRCIAIVKRIGILRPLNVHHYAIRIRLPSLSSAFTFIDSDRHHHGGYLPGSGYIGAAGYGSGDAVICEGDEYKFGPMAVIVDQIGLNSSYIRYV